MASSGLLSKCAKIATVQYQQEPVTVHPYIHLIMLLSHSLMYPINSLRLYLFLNGSTLLYVHHLGSDGSRSCLQTYDDPRRRIEGSSEDKICLLYLFIHYFSISFVLKLQCSKLDDVFFGLQPLTNELIKPSILEKLG